MALPSAPPPNNLDWHCEISGTGKIPLICVPGWGCEGSQFEELGRILGADHRVYRPDLPGHGKTPLGDFEPGFQSYSAALAEWVNRQNIQNPILVGHSMGGVLSLMAANRINARAVVNLDGSLPAAASTLAGQAKIRGWLNEPDLRQRLVSVLKSQFFLLQERDARADQIVHTMSSAPDSVLRFLPETITTLNPSKILSGLHMPVLYIGAKTPRFDIDEAKSLLPRLHLEQIQDAGHFLQVFAAAKVAKIIRAFLA